jgi:hypothetical protein
MSLSRPNRLLAAAGAALLATSLAGASHAGNLPPGSIAIVDTAGPGGPLGVNGFDVFREQRVAERFTVPADGDMNFLRTSLWLMNNSGTDRAQIVVSLQTDALDEGGAETKPSGIDLEHWVTRVHTWGWSPVEQFFVTQTAPLLKAGRKYWIVVASNADGGDDPVWAFARKGTLWSTTTSGGHWQAAGEGGAITLRVDALPVNAQATRP